MCSGPSGMKKNMKKLHLGRETLRHLDSKETSKAAGGRFCTVGGSGCIDSQVANCVTYTCYVVTAVGCP